MPWLLQVFEGFTLAVAFIIGLGQLEMALDLPLARVNDGKWISTCKPRFKQ